MEKNAAFLIYKANGGKSNVEVRLENETIWLTQYQIAEIFQTDRSSITKHIAKIYESSELSAEATCAKIAQVQIEGKRQIKREVLYYNLDVIISVGYRVNSFIGTQFRIWASQQLKEFLIKGFVMDDERLSGNKKNYFDELQERVRAIRSSERNFWQKVTDIFATSIDYEAQADYSKKFFANVQNMFHYAIHGRTAAELIWERVDAQKINLGLATWKGGSISKEDVTVAKNFLDETELRRLNLLVEQYLSFAELQTIEKRPMRMSDWYKKLNGFFILNDKPILVNFGTVKAEMSKKKAVEEYNKYERKRQDALGKSNSSTD